MSNQTAAPVAPQAPETNVSPELTIDQVAQAIDQKNAQPNPLEVKPETKAEAKKIKQLKLKVYGNELVEDLPFEIDDNPEVIEYLTRQLQMSKAADRALKDKGNQEKQFENFFANLKENPEQILEQLGINTFNTEWAAKKLQKEIEREQLSPEARKSLELEEKLKNLEEQTKKKENEFKQREFEAKREQIQNRLENQMIQALDKSELPHTPWVADRIAKYMMMGLADTENPVELTPEDVLPLVQDDLHRNLQETIKKMKKEKVEEFIGKDIFTEIRKKNIEKIKQNSSPATKTAVKEVTQPQKPASKPVDQSKTIPARKFFGI